MRETLVDRYDEGQHIRRVEFQMKTDELDRQHESFELKWDGERDVDAYKRQMAKERYECLSVRNVDGCRILSL
jgi:hypothetical protein